MSETSLESPLPDRLRELRSVLEGVSFPFEVGNAAVARRARDELAGQIDDYLLPRLDRLDAPLLAVVGGSTGAGKSTLINSIVRSEVSPAGVLRPTTRTPTLVCNPDDLPSFEGDRVLPGLPRARGVAPADGRALHLVPDDDVAPGLALLDAPDIDSIVEENRQLAAQLLAAADLWLFATTASRYADAVPWEFLRIARSRSVAMAIVLNRVPPEARDDVPAHFTEMLERNGLAGAPLFVIGEGNLERGLIPESQLAPLRRWLDELARDEGTRRDVIRRTLDGALASISPRTELIASAIDAQMQAVEALEDAVESGYALASARVDDALESGDVLRGEVLARWHELVGTGELMQSLEAGIGRVRDWLRSAVTGQPTPAGRVTQAVGDSLQMVIVAAAEEGAERAADAWRSSPAGRELLASHPELERASRGLADVVPEHIREWQRHVLQLVTAEGASKRSTGRVLSLGVNAIGAALMVATFAHTGGLTGGEIAIAGGTAAVSQKVLEALFGDQAVRELTARARSDLIARVDALLAGEKERYRALLHAATPGREQAATVRAAAEAIQATLT